MNHYNGRYKAYFTRLGVPAKVSVSTRLGILAQRLAPIYTLQTKRDLLTHKPCASLVSRLALPLR